MKTWFVTGCSSGIGAGLAKAVLEKGDQAVVTARSIEKVKGLEEKYPDRCLALTLDVTADQSGTRISLFRRRRRQRRGGGTVPDQPVRTD